MNFDLVVFTSMRVFGDIYIVAREILKGPSTAFLGLPAGFRHGAALGCSQWLSGLACRLNRALRRGGPVAVPRWSRAVRAPVETDQ